MFTSIQSFYDAWKSGEAPATKVPVKKVQKRKPVADVVSTSEELFSMDMIRSEIFRTEKRLSVLKKMMELVKEL